jgi:DNA-binding NtrC family response regulator
MSAMTPRIARAAGGALIASPSKALREQVLHSLNNRWRPIQHALGGADALAKLEEGGWQVLFLDRRLPDLDSEELRAIIERRFPGIQVVLLDADAESPADEAARADQSPVLPAPLAAEDEDEDESRTAAIGDDQYDPLPGMIGRSEAMQSIYRLAQLVAPRSTTVLVVGPTGSGKELVARALHALSPRAAKPFVAVNCAAIPEALLESELFGHARGAFTGAVQAQVGRIPAAHGGTLFLDEVSELPFGMQAKLLRFLEQKEVQRLGTAELTRVDVRVDCRQQCGSGGARGQGGISRRSFLPPLRVSPGTSAARGAPQRHCSPGEALSGLHGSRDERSRAASERRGGGDSRTPRVKGQCAGVAARDGAGLHPGGERKHGFE